MKAPKSNVPAPPRWAVKLLTWLHPSDTLEEVEGDLAEMYVYWYEQSGIRKAKVRYVWSVFSLLPPFVRQRSKTRTYPSSSSFYTGMLYSYLTIAFRNLKSHKAYSFINIAGLTFGLTACLLIGLFVRDERQFDQFIPQGDQIYRVHYQITSNEGISYVASTPPAFTTALQLNFPEVENTVRVLNNLGKELIEANNIHFYEEKGIYADPTFFELFPLIFSKGSAVKALEDPNAIIVSEDMANRYFGNTNPIGKEVLVDKNPYQIKGVIQPNPKFHLDIHYILPMAASGLTQEQLQSWTTYSYNNYVKLKKGTEVKLVEARFQAYVRPHIKDELAIYKPIFQPLHQIHLYSSDFKYDIAQRGNITYVKALITIAVFILLIACFNFVNLATAKSLQRAKEVGVRKTVGASRKQLIVQYMGETVFLTFISILLSVGFTSLLLPSLNHFTEKHIVFDLFTNPLIAPFLLLLTFTVGILAGFYPALVLSGFKPVSVLKGSTLSEALPGRTPWLRHGLVVIQFSLSVLLIISAIVVITQVNYLHNKDLGFAKDEIMFFPMRGDYMNKNYEAFKQELLQLPGVSSVTIGYGFPGDMFGDGLVTAPIDGEPHTVKATQIMVDPDYIQTLGLQLVAGRNFSKELLTDKDAAYIVNETAVKEYGFTSAQQALGQTLLWNTWRKPDLVKKGQIIGVVKDFHFKSLYDKVEPVVLHIYPEAYWKVAVKMKRAGIDHTIAYVKNTWNKFTPDYPIEYKFLDENFDQMYKAEDKLKSLLWVFTCITIFVACLGLSGLAAYGAERKRKEIGIRKVLGASEVNIVLLLSKDFVKLIILSLLIASPIAWYAMNSWLNDFAYRINLEWWIFVVAGAFAIVIALCTISFQSVKAAFVNPIKSLRTE